MTEMTLFKIKKLTRKDKRNIGDDFFIIEV